MSTTTLAQRVADHMTSRFPTDSWVGGWIAACEPETGDAVVVWRPVTPVQPRVRGSLLYRWLSDLRDAGFTAEACTDMAVFGRPDEQSPDRVARYLRITDWSALARAKAPAPLPPLPPAPPHRDVDLPPAKARDFACPLSGTVPAFARFRYLPGHVEVTLTYETPDTGWGAAVPHPPPWLLALAEQHRPTH